MWWVVLILVPQLNPPQMLQCNCVCVEGVPSTFCRSIDAATKGAAGFCGQHEACADSNREDLLGPDAWRQDGPTLDELMDEHACREVRVLHPSGREFTGVKICSPSLV